MEKVSARIKRNSEVIKGDQTRHFEKGQEMEVDLETFKELMNRGVAVPAGLQHGKPVRMDE